jgi:hypothetical protein
MEIVTALLILFESMEFADPAPQELSSTLRLLCVIPSAKPMKSLMEANASVPQDSSLSMEPATDVLLAIITMIHSRDVWPSQHALQVQNGIKQNSDVNAKLLIST